MIAKFLFVGLGARNDKIMQNHDLIYRAQEIYTIVVKILSVCFISE